jgi:hypothetical protein
LSPTSIFVVMYFRSRAYFFFPILSIL